MKNRNIIKILLFVLLLANVYLAKGQEQTGRFRMHGTVVDARTGKGIKNIPITVLPFKRKINADSQGRFLFNMPQGEYTLLIDDYPFDKTEITISIDKDTTLFIALESPEYSRYLEEIEVVAAKPATETPAGITRLGGQSLLNIPAVAGERDLLKALTLTAGVLPSNEGAADMQVRGGGHGQNLFLLDGIPMYSTQHVFGMMSAFNPSIIRTSMLYKSAFPAEYGGKISSVLNVISKDADPSGLSGEAEIGILSTKAMLNIPLVKDKLAFSVAGRISNFSIANLLSVMEDTKVGLHFGDINANLYWKISEKDRLKFTFFHNSDGTRIGQKDESTHTDTDVWMKNKQQNAGINWNRTLSSTAVNQLTAYIDRYIFDFGTDSKSLINSEAAYFSTQSTISSWALEDKLNWNISEHWNLNTGISVKGYRFLPFRAKFSESLQPVSSAKKPEDQFEGNAFAQVGFSFAEKQNINGGLRFSAIGNSEKVFTFVEPRIAYHGVFDHNISLSASVSRMSQPIHRVANPGVGIQMELFFPSDASVVPEESWVYSLGGAKDFAFNNCFVTLKSDLWYKQMFNIVEYKEGYDAMMLLMAQQNINDDIREIVTQGEGKAYGIDISAEYIRKNFSISAGYTLMQARNRFDELNNGNEFAASTDIRHSLSLSGEINLSPAWSFSASWQYRTGRPITLPTAVFIYPEFNFKDGNIGFGNNGYQGIQTIETERNNYRTKSFHKLDISFIKRSKAFNKYDSFMTIGIYNLYNRANPYLYYVGMERTGNGSYPVLKSLSLFPILPSFSYMIKF